MLWIECAAGTGCHVKEGCLIIISEDQELAIAYHAQPVMPFMSLASCLMCHRLCFLLVRVVR